MTSSFRQAGNKLFEYCFPLYRLVYSAFKAVSDRGERKLIRAHVRPGMVVVDAGANIGTHTLALANMVGPSGAVLAFEPQRMSFQILCGNMALNSVTNARCYHAAVGAEAGKINVPALDYSLPNNFGGLSLNLDIPGEQVDLKTLDSFELPALRLLKIDVEGMELNVLQGAVQTIEKYKPCLYVENDRMQNSPALMQYIGSLGYEMYRHTLLLFNPGNYFQNPHNVFGNTVSPSLVCMHKSWGVTMQGFERATV